MTDDPAGEFIDAINQLNRACAKLGVSNPTMIGMRTALGVNAVEAAIRATKRRVDLRDVQGGFVIAGVTVRVGWVK